MGRIRKLGQQGKLLPAARIREIIRLYSLGESQSYIARSCDIARSTVQDYFKRVERLDLSGEDLYALSTSALLELLEKGKLKEGKFEEHIDFCLVHEKIDCSGITLILLWQEGVTSKTWNCSYGNFCRRYKKWCQQENLIPKHLNNRSQEHFLWMHKLSRGRIKSAELKKSLSGKIDPKDMDALLKNIHDKRCLYRNRSITILAYLYGIPAFTIAEFLLAKSKTINYYIKIFQSGGITGLLDFSKQEAKKSEDPKYKDKVFEILHSPPSAFDINRTSWIMRDIQRVMAEAGLEISLRTIRRIINDAGYKVKRAKKVLTSTDPNYREKLQKITQILSNLGVREKFFSIDEYGPFSVKMQGGRSLVAPGEEKIVPQWQQSKGKLILTAAIELSTNQVTHFYSEKKDTEEMIKLLEVLLEKYADEDCIYLSWDAAAWHASHELYEKVEKVNSPEYKKEHKSPTVKLAPLPASAQFLNIIESIFSGMARAIIHNSDYQSIEECKAAIDRYFQERNQHFKDNPKRAGNKIWGKERVEVEFRESNNCKDPCWR